MSKIIKIMFLMLILIFSVGIVSAESDFTTLQNEIDNGTTANNSFTLYQDYKYNNSVDTSYINGIKIDNDNFTLDGDGYSINGNYESRILNINANNVTIKNINLINGNGGAIYSSNYKNLLLNNVNFVNNSGERGGAVSISYGSIEINNSNFTNNSARWGGSIYSGSATVIVNNSIFMNSTSNYAGAIYSVERGGDDAPILEVYNSKFLNLYANETGGAIGISNTKTNNIIQNSTFVNISSKRNGGAIFVDTSNLNLIESNFTNSYSEFGGAIVLLLGELTINNSNFRNNTAYYDGGAIYVSFTELNIVSSNFISNQAIYEYERGSYGGALYIDYSEVKINNSLFKNNLAKLNGGAISIYDVQRLIMFNNIFEDNGEGIYAEFSSNISLINNTFNNDSISLNNTPYVDLVIGYGVTISLVNNSIIIANFPSRFDLRDFNWLTPVKNQGDMGACWAFASLGALESALLKATEVEYDFSENNMQNSMLQYSKYGFLGLTEGGLTAMSMGYFLSWFGAFSEEYDTYDELGKLSPLFASEIHVQDIYQIPGRQNFSDNDKIKDALIKFGALDTSISWDFSASANNGSAFYNPDPDSITNHAVVIVGWNDNYSKDNFMTTPPGDGAFIVRNSWGTSAGDNGYYYVSYYDSSLARYGALAYIINNTVNYNKNYQYDIGGKSFYVNGYEYYANQYTAWTDDLIAAVGTYFEFYNMNYEMEIFVNDELKYAQNGINLLPGFATIKLNQFIKIEENDTFKVVMKSYLENISSVPFMSVGENSFYNGLFIRNHLQANQSFVSRDGINWEDLYYENITANLKVYTVLISIIGEDLIKYYGNETPFEAIILDNNGFIQNTNITLKINNITYTRSTDANGTVKLNINLLPGNYTIYVTNPIDGVTLSFNVEILPTLIGENIIMHFRNGTQFKVTVLDKNGKLLKNTNVEFNINGVFYTRKTNELGIVVLNINLNPGEYIITTIGLDGLKISNNITVLTRLIGYDLNKTFGESSNYEVKVLNNVGNPLAGETISVNINGLFYDIISADNGIAKLNINLDPGSYIATASWNEYSTSNIINVKS